MFYKDYWKATSWHFGMTPPGKYRSLTVRYTAYYSVVHSHKCRGCRNLPRKSQWTGPIVCGCGNPYVNICKDNDHWNRIKAHKQHQTTRRYQ